MTLSKNAFPLILALFGALTGVFVTSKLLGITSWSWWWVLVPVGGIVAAIGIFVMAALRGLSRM